MALDRGTLAKIDRRVFAEFDHGGGVQAVKVPVSDAVWSTWRRYCEAMGLSMGEGVAGLILNELTTVVGADDAGTARLAERASRQIEERASELDAREHQLDALSQQLRAREEHLRGWERRRSTQGVAASQVQPNAKVGRNQRCPCGSGLKYKHCHGLPGRSG